MSELKQALDQSSQSINGTVSGHTTGSVESAQQDIPSGYQHTDAGVIPKDWGVTTVGAEFTVQLGKMLDAAKNTGDWKPYIGNRAVQWGRIDVEDIGEVRLTRKDIQRYRLRNGDLLVCEGGEIGRSAIWHNQIPECYFQKALHRLRPTGEYNAYLLMSLLQMWAVTGGLTNFVTQTSIAHLPKERLKQIRLPLPSAAEQDRIANALSNADALIESLDRLIAKKRAIKQAAMQQLLTGQTRLPGFGGAWETKRLGDIASFHKGHGLSKADLTKDGTTACIHYGELFTQYGEEITDVLSRTNSDSASCPAFNNDVLMPTSDVTPNGLATASAVGVPEVLVGGDVLVIRVSETVLHGTFLAYMIRMSRGQVMQLVSGTTVFHIYGRDMAHFTFSAPSVAEQVQIVAVLSDMDSEIAALELRRKKTEEIKQGMLQQLLTGRVRLVKPGKYEAQECLTP